MSNRQWERVERKIAYRSTGRARYPSLAREGGDRLLLLFTERTPEQERNDGGELRLTRSADGGHTWSVPVLVHRDDAAEPRAMGTLTVLSSGRMVAPFAEYVPAPEAKRLRMAISDDGGEIWEIAEPHVESPLFWMCPVGRILEVGDGRLCMAVHGARTASDLSSGVHGCALLFSTDGHTWGDFAWIAEGDAPILGAHPDTRFGFEGPALQSLPDGRLLAVLSARRFNQGPGAPQVLVRLWSEDGGRTWSPPEQLTVGGWPCLAGAGEGWWACVFATWSAWGDLRVLFSDDGFASFRQERPLYQNGWLHGTRYWRNEIPLPPVLPGDDGPWLYEHYGFPSAVCLADGQLAVAFGRTQRGSVYWNNIDMDLSMEQERIDVVFYAATEDAEGSAVPEARIPASGSSGGGAKEAAASARHTSRPAGRWVLARRFKAVDFSSVVQTRDGALMGMSEGEVFRSRDGGESWVALEGVTVEGDVFGSLRSGRWLAARLEKKTEPNHPDPELVGERGGYPVQREHGFHVDYETIVLASGDEGRSWQTVARLRDPLLWAVPFGRFIEIGDEVLLPVYGTLTPEDTECYAGCNGLFRSADGGETWDDFSLVLRHGDKAPEDPHPEPRYTELDVQPLPDGRWVALSRTEYGSQGPMGVGGRTSVTFSSDRGHTWSKPLDNLMGGGQQFTAVFPDGGLVIATRSHTWQQPGLYVSYNWGESWSYAVAGPYSTSGLVRVGDDRMVLFTNYGRDAAVYRYQDLSGSRGTRPASAPGARA